MTFGDFDYFISLSTSCVISSLIAKHNNMYQSKKAPFEVLFGADINLNL